ncbi:MAG: hypothetical protein KGL39_12485 [Patescibacteria group bacterium]|nr:hypothetical protein [Patescibacteria group bacterium]
MSFSAKAFDPYGTVSLSVTDASGNVGFAVATDTALIQNTGANTAYFKRHLLSNGTAATTDTPLQAGAAICVRQDTFAYLAAICDTGKTTTLKITSGSGNPELSLSAEVAISGLVVTAISEAQANAAAQSWTEGTNNPLSQNLTGDLRTISKQSGTWTVATNADAAIAAGAAPPKALVAGGVYNSSAPAPTTGQTLALQTDASGRLLHRNSPAATGTQTSVASSGSDGTILAANAARIGATIYNDSTQILYLLLASGTSSNTNYSVQLVASAYYEVPAFYTGVIKGLWASANGNARVTEFAV